MRYLVKDPNNNRSSCQSTGSSRKKTERQRAQKTPPTNSEDAKGVLASAFWKPARKMRGVLSSCRCNRLSCHLRYPRLWVYEPLPLPGVASVHHVKVHQLKTSASVCESWYIMMCCFCPLALFDLHGTDHLHKEDGTSGEYVCRAPETTHHNGRTHNWTNQFSSLKTQHSKLRNILT